MKLIAIASMKGGVGKTTTTANLASALLAEQGGKGVFVVDLDPQNALHLHFDFLERSNEGICSHGVRSISLKGALRQSASGVGCFPYGAATEQERQAFQDMLRADPDWLYRELVGLGLPKNSIVLIDTPPGNTVYLQQAFRCADIVLLLLLADAGSYLTLPAMEGWLVDALQRYPQLLAVYVVNQADNGQPLHRDMLDVLRLRLGDRLAPVSIHRDEAVPEAMAFQQSIIRYDPHGQATQDVCRLAFWVRNQLINQ